MDSNSAPQGAVEDADGRPVKHQGMAQFNQNGTQNAWDHISHKRHANHLGLSAQHVLSGPRIDRKSSRSEELMVNVCESPTI